MKKLLIVLFVMLLAFAMFSCGNTPEGTGDSSIPSSTDNSVNGDAPHTHAYGEWAIVVQATCTAKGEEKRTCSCGEFETREIAIIPHTEIVLAAKNPTCLETGLTEGKGCSACGGVLVAQITIEVLPHTEEVLLAKDPSCTEAGLTEGKKCSECDTVIIPQSPIETIPHVEKAVEGKAATCEEDGLTDGIVCEDCGHVILAQEIIPASHTPETIEGTDASCYETGLTPGSKCSECGEILVKQEIIPITHSPETLERVEPNCYSPGWTEGEWCSICYTVLIPQEEIPVKHIPVVSEGYPADCFNNGLKDGIVCDNCGTIIQEQEIIPAAHEAKPLPGVIATCTQEGLTDGIGCKNCDTILKAQEVIPYTIHNFVDGLCTHCSITSFSQELNYVLSDDGTYYIVKGIGTCKDKKVVIPETYKNKPVKEIATSAFASVNSFYSIVIPSSIERIGSDAFNYANRLIEVYNLSQHINIQIGVEDDSKLGKFAKYEYNSLDTPSAIETVEDFDFTVVNGTSYLLGYNGKDARVTLPSDYKGGQYKIYDHAFTGHKQIVSIVVPNAVLGTGPSSFSSCTSLVEVYNLSGLQLEYNGVWQYGDLGKFAIAIHNSEDAASIVDIVGDFAFVTKNDIPFLVAYLGSDKVVTLPADYKGNGYAINKYALAGAKFEHITIPGTVFDIGEHAFTDCLNLKSITLEEGIGSIGNYAFSYTGLRQVVIPDSVTFLGTSAFGACESLGIVYIGDGIATISPNAFNNCPNLASVRLPKYLTSIGNGAFNMCDKIREIINPSTLNITSNSDDHGGVGSSYYAIIYKGDTAKQSAFIVDDFTFILIDGAYHLVSYLGNDGTVVLPSGVNDTTYTIGYKAFADRSFMYEVIVPEGVIAIDASAFESCVHLKKVTIAGTVKTLANSVFRWSSQLETVILEEGVESLGRYVFYSCAMLESIELPKSLKGIGKECFKNCTALTSIKFGNPNGWYRTSTENATSGTDVTYTSDPKSAASALVSSTSYLYRKTN